MSFIHLHTHSCYSFLDGAATPGKLLEKAVEYEMPALALTDHNRLTGSIRFYDKAKRLDVKPIIGAEVNIEGGHHLTLLCKNITGYSCLCRLLTDAHLSTRNHQPFVSRETLLKHNSGLIALSGCLKGEIPSLLKKKLIEEAELAAGFYRYAYGNDFFIELTRYPSMDGMALSHSLNDFATAHGIPAVATNNVHYINRQDYRIRELLNAIGRNIPVSQLKEYRTTEQYFKSPAEMADLFRDFPNAIAMTGEIASQCNLELPLGHPRFPRFELPPGETSCTYLSRLAYAGAFSKYGTLSLQVTNRLEMELVTIRQLGFCDYFLAVWDIVRWSREKGIRCLARGSAVDSLVVYALDISIVDPIHYNLLFERFMHPLRREPPDIDLDIDRKHRDEVRDYVYQKYGSKNVASVGTINTFMARGAIRTVGKALQLPQETLREACKSIHYLSSAGLMEKASILPELKGNTIYTRPEMQNFFQLCAAIDGYPRHMSVHLGGLLIGDGWLSDLVPLEWSSGGDIISQYDKNDIERLGIVKMDLLALPTITIIEDSVKMIKENYGAIVDINHLPPHDPEVFSMLRDGKTVGTFQLESPAQREMAGRLLPDSFEDIIVSISLVRPGPLKSNMDKTYLARRHGKEMVTYLHPRLENALKETLGVILYQEQVLKVAHDLAGMSYAEADGFRRAMTHDRTDTEMEGMRDSFIRTALKNGVSREIANTVFEQLAAFAAYGFCKAHAVAYATLSYQTLWLKSHYPAEFFAALLSNQPMGYYPSRVLIAETRRAGISVIGPDINCSRDCFSVEDGAVRVGLRQIKGISEESVQSIMQARKKGLFTSLRDFLTRTSVNHPVIEKMIKIGAFDSLASRRELLLELKTLRRLAEKRNENLELFFQSRDTGMNIINDNIADSNTKENPQEEMSVLSLSLSAHPLDFYNLGTGFTRIKDLPSIATGSIVKIAGSVIRYQTPSTRNGKRVVYVIMEDGTGIADVTVFSDIQEKCGQLLFRSGWLTVEAKIQRRGPKALSLIALSLSPLKPQDQSELFCRSLTAR